MELYWPNNPYKMGDIMHMVVRKHPLKTTPYMVVFSSKRGDLFITKVRKCKKNLKYFKKEELL